MKFTKRIPKLTIVLDRYKLIEDYCKNKKVLHLGCVDSGLLDDKIGTDKLLHHRLYEVSSYCVGVDIDKLGLEKMAKFYDNLLYGNIEELSLNDKFDVIVAGEIIEHIDNCGRFLNSISNYFNENTILIISTPNASYYLFLIYYLFGYESIHPDHNYLFSINSLKQLLQKYNYKLEKMFIVFEKVNFIKPNDKIIIRLIKMIFNFLFNVPYYLRAIIPQFGKGILFIVRR